MNQVNQMQPNQPKAIKMRNFVMTNRKMLPFLPLLLLCALPGAKSWAQTTYEYGEVIASRPIYQLVEISEPFEQCWEERIAVDRYSYREDSRTPVLVSTIIGGAIGNAVGNGKSNKRVGAVVGAVLGNSIGRDIFRDNNRHRSGPREYEIVQRCETAYELREEERLSGYQVTYLYNGEEYSTRTASDPGERIRLRVSVQPVR